MYVCVNKMCTSMRVCIYIYIYIYIYIMCPCPYLLRSYFRENQRLITLIKKKFLESFANTQPTIIRRNKSAISTSKDILSMTN